MLKITVITILCLVSAVTLFRPWVGAVAYVIFSILAPQTIWFWGFEGIRAALILSVVTVFSLVLHVVMGNVSLSVWKSKQNALILFFWGTILCSYFLGALPPNTLSALDLNSAILLETYNKIFIMFFLLQPLIIDVRVISYLIWALVCVFGYYTYWANFQYLSGAMFLHGFRLGGPSTPFYRGIFADENLFAMLFVMAIPFFFFMAQENRNKIVKIALYLLIPFAWHSVFLTGSRGGLVGISIVTLHIIYRSRSKLLGVLVLVGLIAAFIDQGGDVMKRRSDMIVDYQGDDSAMGRIEAWTLASKMVADNPIFGVGLGNFTVAWQDYKDSKPRVAHSSIVQFAAEDGIFSALAFSFIFVIAAMDLRNIRKAAGNIHASNPREAGRILSIANALEGGGLGFFVCGLFLNLGLYEIFYVCIMIVILLEFHVVKAYSSRAFTDLDTCEGTYVGTTPK